MKAYSPRVTPHTIVAFAPIEPPRLTSVSRYSCLRETWARGFSTLVNTQDGPQNTSSSDRKSTRLNSSHLVISYAVFCLKKKKKHTNDVMLINYNDMHTIVTPYLI